MIEVGVGQYNILANCLANNLKPWYWYGYCGISANGIYRRDGLDEVRVERFGLGRSKDLIRVWEVVGKQYLKLFSTNGFGYSLHEPGLYDKSLPSLYQELVIHRALVDFFYRNNLNGFEGDKDLSYHLFSRTSRHYSNWLKIGECFGLLIDNGSWVLLEQQFNLIKGSQTPTLKSEAIDSFNVLLRGILLKNSKNKKNNTTDTSSEKAFSEALRPLAQLICLNDSDLNQILLVESEFSWERRLPLLVSKIKQKKVHVWGIEELDELDSFMEKVKPFKLAIFKQRSISPKEDGCGIFYDPKVLSLTAIHGKSPLSFVRFSGSAKRNGLPVKLHSYSLPISSDGFIHSENEKNGKIGSNFVKGYAFTENLKPKNMECFDERVAVMAILTHIETKTPLLFICSHLEHTQNDIIREEIRKIQCQQLMEVIPHFLRDLEINNIPAVFLCDMNDSPDVSAYGRNAAPTPVYHYLKTEGWVDIYNGQCPPTSFTLHRKLAIDYILYKEIDLSQNQMKIKGTFMPDEVPVVYLAGHANTGEKKLVRGDSGIAPVYGMPMSAVEQQEPLPSDHLPLTARIKLEWQNKERN